jgi:hypothetical protein
MSFEVIVIKSLDELAEVVCKIPGGWWFRGQTDAGWHLWPKIWRDYDAQTERYLTNLFYQRAKLRHANFPDDNDYAGWLALMQHYGLLTRLLDWSDSALIAAYFATKYDRDMARRVPGREAAIWMISPTELNASQNYGRVFPSLNAKSLVPTVQAAFKEVINPADKIYDVLAAVPVNHDLRMVMQQGAFTIHANEEALDTRPDCGLWLKKLTIPAEFTTRIEMSLGMLGLRLSDVFPDLDNLARDLTNMHPPRKS